MADQIGLMLDRLGGGRRALIVGVGVGATLLILALSRWAAAPDWVPAFTGLPLETVGKVTAQLDEAGIPYRLDQGGAELLVPATELARARVALAGQGLPAEGRPGLELFDQPSWGMTDFTQRINYRRALEGELERTIGKMRGVASAQVHLAMQESRSFRVAERPAEASVVLELHSGSAPSPDVVLGIQHLVASSVDGLESGNVAVLDAAGRMLSLPNEPGSLAALTSRQLGMQREVEGYLEAEVQKIVGQVMGHSNVRVRVSAAINFDRVERTTETVNPDLQVLASEQKSEIVPGPEGGAGSSNTAATYENSRSTESFAAAVGELKRLSVAVLVNHRQVPDSEPAQFQPVSAAELAQIESLVRSAVGFNAQRGDAVSVVSLRFSEDPAALPVEEPGMDLWAIFDRVSRPGIAVLGLLLSFALALRVVGSLRGPARAAGSFAGGFDSFPPVESPEAIEPAIPIRRTVPVVNTVMRDRVVASVEEHPNLAARLVRAWMREG